MWNYQAATSFLSSDVSRNKILVNQTNWRFVNYSCSALCHSKSETLFLFVGSLRFILRLCQVDSIW